ncbi:MAG: tetratricopeptide repeat protein [Bacteroidota bacterium]
MSTTDFSPPSADQVQGPESLFIRIDDLNRNAYEIRHSDPALSAVKSREAIALAEPLNYSKGMASGYLNKGFGEMSRAEYAIAFQTLERAAAIFESIEDQAGKAHSLYNIAVVYSRIGEYKQGVEAFQGSLSIRQSLLDLVGEAACLMQIAYIYDKFGNRDEASKYYDKGIAIHRQISDPAGLAATLIGRSLIRQQLQQFDEAEADLLESCTIRERIGETNGWLVSMNYLGEFYLTHGKLEDAERYLFKAINIAKQQVTPFHANLCRLYASVSKIYVEYKEYERAGDYLKQALQTAIENNIKYQIYDIHLALSNVNRKKGDFESALISYQDYHKEKEEVINITASTNLKNLELANGIESEKKEAEIHRLRHIELKKAYDELQKTQEQLVRSEKLAYLGQVTAGIAHEIQNPLNFVNNFSDVTVELVEELGRGPLQNLPQSDKEEANELMNFLIQNLQKISHHGKRAGEIVKGMLEHSRSNNGKRDFADLNKLAEEYLRISYHGVQAKDTSAYVILHTNYDSTIGPVNIISQDIGKVLLNLMNNAFYSVMQRRKNSTGSFEPTITLTTKKTADGIEVSVIDNGVGIPPGLVEKIYLPFFTTKPTGEGTGLGLSMSFDIIRAHGGILKVASEEGNGAEFKMILPLQSGDFS